MATSPAELLHTGSGFAELLAEADRCARQLDEDGLLSLAIPLRACDPLRLLPQLDGVDGDGFRFLWDGAPGLCIAASGRAHSLELSGPRRFELAQRFTRLCLGRLGQAPARPTPRLARPRVLLAFGFFDAPLEAHPLAVPGVQVVLPRWQLSRHGQHCWLRLQRPLGGSITARGLAEELWEKARELEVLASSLPDWPASAELHVLQRSAWQERYRLAASQALALVEETRLQKLVLAVRQQLELSAHPDPLALLAPLRRCSIRSTTS
ncbi:MAG: hypothetical protein ACKO50_02725 [Cyanobium sp.]